MTQENYTEEHLLEGVVVEPIRSVDPKALFDCYKDAFSSGDAKFFVLQNEKERARFYREELGFPDVLDHPASFAYKIEDVLVGFTLVLDGLKNNYHISCMCVFPIIRIKELVRPC